MQRQMDPLDQYKQCGINKDQELKLKQTFQQFKDWQAKKGLEHDKYEQQMRQLSLMPEVEENRLLAIQEQLNKINSDYSIRHVKLVYELRRILTPQQRQKLIASMKASLANPRPMIMPMPMPVKPSAGMPLCKTPITGVPAQPNKGK